MRSPPQMLSIVKASRHQGEGLAGRGPRFHVVTDHGTLMCAAVPRSINKPKVVYKREVLRGLFKPLCRDCRSVAFPKPERKR